MYKLKLGRIDLWYIYCLLLNSLTFKFIVGQLTVVMIIDLTYRLVSNIKNHNTNN